MIGISMGDYGQPGRILAPILGSPITYACIDENLKTAPGQLSVEALKDLSLNENTAIYGLIGDPVDKSIGDKTHNFCFRSSGIEAVYVKMKVKETELGEFLKLARKLPFRGLSVTMPLKKSILSYLDEIDPKARQIGAVNTLVFENGKIIGYNTDGVGALRAIKRSVKGEKIAILGTGGAAQSIAYEARLQGAQVVLLKRNEYETEYDILINCTPALSPIDPAYILPKSLVMDITTNPKETLFLRHALEKGCKVIYGYQMFIEQALGQFDLWFKDRIDRDILERKVREIL
jgi:3-dehydroquinate dehydratase/shikimate dehydrogenase